MTMVVVRKANPEDIDDLAAIEQACFDTPWSRESLLHDLTENEMACISSQKLTVCPQAMWASGTSMMKDISIM